MNADHVKNTRKPLAAERENYLVRSICNNLKLHKKGNCRLEKAPDI